MVKDLLIFRYQNKIQSSIIFGISEIKIRKSWNGSYFSFSLIKVNESNHFLIILFIDLFKFKIIAYLDQLTEKIKLQSSDKYLNNRSNIETSLTFLTLSIMGNY